LAIGFVSTADYSLLPPLVRRFRRRRPGVSLSLRELTGDRQLALIASGELDLGFAIAPVAAPGLATRTVHREPLIAALPARHRLAGRRAVAARELGDEDFILFPRPLAPGLYDLVIAACGRAGFVPTIAQEAVQMQTILGLVAAGLGVALVPACMAKLGRPDLAFATLRPPSGVVETVAAWRSDDRSPVLARPPAAVPRP